MAVNRLGIGSIAFPQSMEPDVVMALEELIRKIDDNINYLLKPSIVSVSGTYTATDLNHTILASTTLTVNLPQSSTCQGKILVIKRTGTGNVTVDGYSTETIDGSTTSVISAQYNSLMIQSDGSNWHVLAVK